VNNAEVGGIDVWNGQWVAVVLRGGVFQRARIAKRVTDLIDELGDMPAIGIDMPIGLTSGAERREADAAARAFVGLRGRSVFPTYPREVYRASDYGEARRVSISLTGISISRQAYALGERLLELEAAVAQCKNVWEVHPEVSFRAMAGRPLPWPKSSWNGINDRLGLLRGVGIDLPASIDELGNAGVEDVLDAAAAAWTASRIAAGTGESLPSHPQQFAGGRPLAIWY
jgi:predicted RNase H-like nuclease